MANTNFFGREMEAFRSSPRDGDGSIARERVHMQGEDSLAAARARWAKLQPENLQHVQDTRRIDREQQARQQSDQTPRVTLLGSGVQRIRKCRARHLGKHNDAAQCTARRLYRHTSGLK